MNKTLFFLIVLMPLSLFAQSNMEEKKLTKFEEFSSRTGIIVKFVDVAMPNIPKRFMGNLESGIRTIKGGSSNSYFYRIEEAETSLNIAHIAMIEYSDLVEINRALTRLISEVDTDIAKNPDYLENKFKTVDGFEIGYYVSKGQTDNWYIKLERYSKSTVFIKNKDVLVEAFSNAQKKIEELKAAEK